MQTETTLRQVAKTSRPEGRTPALLLVDPKYPHNVGAAVRAASCFGVGQLWWTGNRVRLDSKERLPREERMKGYRDVELRQFEYPYEHFPDAVPVAIELLPGSESLADFEHPEQALYVFGPEDGGISKVHRRHCHRFVQIPTRHCTNLSAAVYLVLYDRLLKRYRQGRESLPELAEPRGFVDTERNEDVLETLNPS